MTEIDLNNPDVLLLVQRELNENAKFYWWLARITEAAVLVIGILTIFLPDGRQGWVALDAIERVDG